MPEFSVIITTRNRPELFEIALQSVLSQKDVPFEVVVINDGSDESHRPAYDALEGKYGDGSGEIRVRFINLISSMRGHGPSYALNQGARHAQGAYLAFLDDDDWWTCDDHLSVASAAIRAQADEIDLYLSLQEAWQNSQRIDTPRWMERNLAALTRHPTEAPHIYRANAAACMTNWGFAHVNTVIIRRDYFLSIGGFDEDVRYESDRQFFLRALDKTDSILFTDRYVSRHNIPDRKEKNNITTVMNTLEKFQYQLTLLNKLYMFAEREEIRQYGKRSYGYISGHIAEEYAKIKDYRKARHYAGLALMSNFSFGAARSYIYLAANSLFRSNSAR